jgi:hypothetical protein
LLMIIIKTSMKIDDLGRWLMMKYFFTYNRL